MGATLSCWGWVTRSSCKHCCKQSTSSIIQEHSVFDVGGCSKDMKSLPRRRCASFMIYEGDFAGSKSAPPHFLRKDSGLRPPPSCADAGFQERPSVGVLIHGCHLGADGWEGIVWGLEPDQLGRVPHSVLLALEEDASVLVFGTGASERDGKKEGEYTLQYMWARWSQLSQFESFKDVSLDLALQKLRKIAIAETESQNTDQEVRKALELFQKRKCEKAIMVSSPTHLPRCLASACNLMEKEPDLFTGAIYASPSDTCYKNAHAGDVVVVEPPHRGDRDKTLDDLPFHQMVRRYYRVPATEKYDFLGEFDALLSRYGV